MPRMVHRPSGLPKKPRTGVRSAVGSVSKNRRSRKRLAFSQEVSEAKERQWQAAPYGVMGSAGVRIAHTGSEEQRAARRNAEVTRFCSRTGSASATNPPRVPSLSDAVVQIRSPAAPSHFGVVGQA